MAHDGGDRRTLLIVRVDKEPAGGGREAEDAKIIPGDEGAHDGPGNGLRTFAAHGYGTPRVARLRGCQLLKFREVLFECVVRFRGEERVVATVVGARVDTTVVLVTDADEGFGVGHGKIAQENGVDQSKDGRVGADAERQGEQHGKRETRRLAQLAETVHHILQQNPHRKTSEHTSVCRSIGQMSSVDERDFSY